MLVLSRNRSEKIVIGDNISVERASISNGVVRPKIVAPKKVLVPREELLIEPQPAKPCPS